ncbi:MAG: DUF4314 domain-containing protein [Lachnospiraceae bacterium]|nr:DUF4314 domain-containing protein [Lachnospiraceae bacterium]
MKMISKKVVQGIKETYPKGTRVELVSMDDQQAPPPGTRGTVVGVDDTGSLLMRWDNGSSLNVLYQMDTVRKLHPVKTICYREETLWEDRYDALKYFLQAMNETDGSERERYTNIHTKLMMGMEVCSDDR